MKKNILITGASSGIGRASAIYFAEKSWNVIATMRNIADGQDLAIYPNVILSKLDVQDYSSINQAIKDGISHFGKIDVVLNNAGYGIVGAFEAAKDEQIYNQFDINVFGVMRVIKSILPHFKVNNSGMIINLSSIGGKITFPSYSLYNSSKWALEGFTEALAFELKQFNIKMKLVEPGPINTSFYGRSQVETDIANLPEYKNYINKVKSKIAKYGANAVGPEYVAERIYQIANSDSEQLRYPVGPGIASLAFFRRVIPDSFFNFLVRLVIER